MEERDGWKDVDLGRRTRKRTRRKMRTIVCLKSMDAQNGCLIGPPLNLRRKKGILGLSKHSGEKREMGNHERTKRT